MLGWVTWDLFALGSFDFASIGLGWVDLDLFGLGSLVLKSQKPKRHQL